MSARRLLAVFVRVASVGCAAALALVVGLPPLAARPDLPAPLWAWLAPLAGALAAAGFAIYAHRSIERQRHGPETLSALPTALMRAFAVGALIVLAVVGSLGRDELSQARPWSCALAGVAIIAALALLLRTLVHPTLLLAASEQAARSDGPRGAASRGLRLRRSLAALALLVAALTTTLSGVYVYAHALSAEQRRADAHLQAVLRATTLSLAALPDRRLARWAARFPAERRAAPLVTRRADGAVLASTPTAAGRRLELIAPWRCRLDGRPLRCVSAPLSRGRAVAIVQPPATARGAVALWPTMAVVALGVLGFALTIGLSVGAEAARDVSALTRYLLGIARGDHRDLHERASVTSIDEVGELTAAVGRLRHRLERELDAEADSVRRTRAAEAQKTQFIADVSHELRTPLNTLCGYAQMLLAGVEGPLTKWQAEDVRVIESGGKQLLGLINDVLDMSVIDSGRLVLELSRFDAARLCHDLVYEKSATVVRSGRAIELSCDLEPDALKVTTDARRLRQILQNLLSNALKFTEEGSVTLRLRLRRSLEDDGRDAQDETEEAAEGSSDQAPPAKEYFELAVRDTGAGIAGDELAAIFEQYHQAGTAATRRRGSGLGLTICRRLIAALGGSIGATSEVGVGSTFFVRLPIEPSRDVNARATLDHAAEARRPAADKETSA